MVDNFKNEEPIINEGNADDWARESAGTPSYCPYCGYSVVEVAEDDNKYACPECGADYELIGHRWNSE